MGIEKEQKRITRGTIDRHLRRDLARMYTLEELAKQFGDKLLNEFNPQDDDVIPKKNIKIKKAYIN
jgi:hypothetical protein